MLFNIKNLRINSFCRNVLSKVIRGNRVHRFRISYCQQYIVNYCCCLQQKVNKLIILLEIWFQRLSRPNRVSISEYVIVKIYS